MARVRTGYYDKGKQVKNCTVSSALTAVGQTIALACNDNLTKVNGSDKLLPHLQVMLGRWRGATFKEYVHKELASFSEGMSTTMKQQFHFVNVAGNSMYNITESIIASDYTVNTTNKIAMAA
jgi:hypothetical protein